MSEEKQIKEVARVKNHINGFIQDPITVRANQSISSVIELIQAHGYGFSTFPVVDENDQLIGLLPVEQSKNAILIFLYQKQCLRETQFTL